MSTPALIGLGSNLGDRRTILRAALEQLGQRPGVAVRAISSFHETEPVGGPSGQGPFLNAAAALDVSIEPRELLHRLHAVELQAGRQRIVRWGERTLDLDLLLFDDQIIQTPDLIVPHPRMAVRRFVLAPLAEVAPEAIDPMTGSSVEALLANLDRRPSVLWMDGPIAGESLERLRSAVCEGVFHGDHWIVSREEFDVDCSHYPTIIATTAAFDHPKWPREIPWLRFEPGSFLAEFDPLMPPWGDLLATCAATRSS